MGWNANWGGGLYTAKDKSQQELRALAPAKDAARLFEALLQTSLWPFVGRIKRVFGPPKSAGLHFELAPGARGRFVSLVDPNALRKVKSLAMRKSPLIPDDLGPNVLNRHFRQIASMNGLGMSFRQQGVQQSLHVAYNQSECDVHVDRNGFVVRRKDGKVHWDLNGVLRHLTVDLIPDKAPWLTGSFDYRDKDDKPVLQGTVAPWLAVDLPSRENGGRTEIKAGILVQGRFRGL